MIKFGKRKKSKSFMRKEKLCSKCIESAEASKRYFEDSSETDSTLSETMVKELLKKFGIIQSSSASSTQQMDEFQTSLAKPLKKRRTTLSISSRRVKKAKKNKKTKKNKRRSIPRTQEHSGTYTVKKISSENEETLAISDTMDVVSDSILNPGLEECDATIEHDSIVTKYGLPYDVIQCACYMKDELFGAEKEPQENTKPVCISQSCYDFEKLYGKSQQPSKYTKDVKKTREYKEACEIYEGITKKYSKTIDEDAFLRAKTFLELFCPNYWAHVSRKYVVYLYEYDITKEKFSKTQVILSCKRLLKEQNLLSQHYRMKMTGLADGLEFGDRLNKNFEIACTFFKEEYPNLFIYMIKKYGLNELVCQKMKIIQNRLKVIKISTKSHTQLKRLNDKYKQSNKKK